MTTQLDIFAIATEKARKSPLESASAWIAANPEAWRYVKSQARFAAEHGHKFGMKALMEHVRWHFAVQRGAEDTYAINNNAVSALARLLVSQCPEVRPYIELRRSTLDGGGRKGDGL